MKRTPFKPNYKKLANVSKRWNKLDKKLQATSGFKQRQVGVPKLHKKRSNGQIGGNKRKVAGIPAWIKAIPESNAHGSCTYQKRLWKLTSDYVRIRDWYKYGYCVATGVRIVHWSQGQAGHLKPYSNCNCLYKFDVRNIHMQSARSNKWGNRDDWKTYEVEARNRGFDIDAFEYENNQQHGCSLRESEVIEQMKVILGMMKDLPEQPDYYQRATSLLESL